MAPRVTGHLYTTGHACTSRGRPSEQPHRYGCAGDTYEEPDAPLWLLMIVFACILVMVALGVYGLALIVG
jgi:hypothetical protein